MPSNLLVLNGRAGYPLPGPYAIEEVHMTRLAGIILIAATFLYAAAPPAHGQRSAYRTPDEIARALDNIRSSSQGPATVETLCETPGGRPLKMLRLGDDGANQPAILVVANMEGNCPIASEAALRLADLIATDWSAERDAYRWYIIPLGNPDGHQRYFSRPLSLHPVNDRPVNNDNDDATDEDPPDDLNGDGFITLMRQKHPEGQWIEVEGNPVLMKRADRGKGEKGIYRLLPEGFDNDGDGDINEDGPGGANPGHNFPHGFEHYHPTNGPWPASEAESRAILQFAFDHPEIAMLVTFGRTNSLKDVPGSSRKTEAAGGSYKVPERWANRLGLDPDKEYPIDELLPLARDYTGYKELTTDELLRWLGVGAAVNPDKGDLTYWKEISKRYNDFIKDAGLTGERLDPPGFSDGCIEEWGYYQYGVPSFSMDFWTVPKPEKPEPDSTEAGPKDKKYGKEKDDGSGADESQEALYAFDSTAFVPWTPFDHPTHGAVEIGGPIAYRDVTPPIDQVDTLLDKQLPFLRQLAGLLPKIAIEKVEVDNKSPGVWKIEAWIANSGFLPYPTHQGQRCQRPTPAFVTLRGNALTFLEGKERTTVGLLEGSGGTAKVAYLVQAAAGTDLTLEVQSPSAGGEQRTITLTGGSGR
jgi:hypothetical protein